MVLKITFCFPFCSNVVLGVFTLITYSWYYICHMIVEHVRDCHAWLVSYLMLNMKYHSFISYSILFFLFLYVNVDSYTWEQDHGITVVIHLIILYLN